MPDFFKNTTGKRVYVNAGFTLSTYTELSLLFKKPDATTVTKTTSDGVTLNTSTKTVDGITMTANQSVYYDIESGLLDTSGNWKTQLLYTNTGVNPDDNLYGSITTFKVIDRVTD